MAKHIKYTKELLEEIVKKSISIAEVLRALGLKEAGGNYCHIQKRIKYYNIDTSHFLGYSYLRGKRSSNKLSWKQILVKRNNGRRQNAYKLRRALIESGIEYKCSECGLKDNWNNKELRLQVDHINKDWLDDKKENLRFLCPNCHSQTDGYNGSKGKTGLLGCKPRYVENIRHFQYKKLN